jgi:RNA polymerase sigma factor (sigma-70 family)
MSFLGRSVRLIRKEDRPRGELMQYASRCKSPIEPGELPFLVDPAVRAAAIRRAQRLLRTRADAEDAVQEATLRALRYRGSLQPGSSGARWFLAIVARVSLDIVARRSRLELLPLEPFARASTPLLDFEQSYTVHTAVEALPSSQRRVVELHDLDGFTTREIASLDGVPHSTIRTRLRRARIALRLALEEVAA